MKGLIVLGIETSGEACRVARIEVDGKPLSVSEALRNARISEREYAGDAARHSEKIWELLEGVGGIKGAGLIAVSTGPGSFTGLRVGMAAAKVFARFGGIALAGVPTLEAVAGEAMDETGARTVLAALDARRGEVYSARYRRSGKTIKLSGKIRICRLEEARLGLPADAVLATRPPRAATVAALGLLRFLSGITDDPGSLVPVYIRRPEAEERRLRVHRQAHRCR